MAKLMSKKTREIVTTTAVLVLVALIIIFYAVYPLLKVPDMIRRTDSEPFKDPEYRLDNNPEKFVEAGLLPDTLTFLSNDNLGLAGLYFKPDADLFDTAKGTVILLHPDDTDRTYFIDYINPLLDSGLTVIVYDQRASGLSGGRFHFGGDYEGDDLVDIIANLNIHEQLVTPLMVTGFGIGGDAVIKAGFNENRISLAIAVDPFLSLNRWIEQMRLKRGLLAIPFSKMIYYWWFQKFTGYPFDRSFADDIKPIAIKTDLFVTTEEMESDEVARLKEISDPALLTIKTEPDSDTELRNQILGLIYSAAKPAPDSE